MIYLLQLALLTSKKFIFMPAQQILQMLIILDDYREGSSPSPLRSTCTSEGPWVVVQNKRA